jgi:hypothetical protein
VIEDYGFPTSERRNECEVNGAYGVGVNKQ